MSKVAMRWANLRESFVMALNAIRARNGSREVPYYAHPGMFRTRAMRLANGAVRMLDDVPSIADLTAQGARVVCTTEPQLFLDDMFHVSGEIPRVTPFERGLPGQVRRTADGKDWEPDEQILDERWLAVHVAGKGLVVFSACSHAGIVNVLHHAREIFPDVRLHAAMGGFHLAGPTEAAIPETVRDLAQFDLDLIIPAHCTGWRAVNALERAYGEKVVVPSAVGKRFSL